MFMKKAELQIEEKIQQYRMSKAEEKAYREYCTSNDPPLPPELQEQLFRVYLNGSSCEKIWKSNKEAFSLGALVAARVEGDWDGKIQDNASDMIAATLGKVARARLESINLLADLISATVQVETDKIAKFTQTQDPNQLGILRIEGLKGLTEAVTVLEKLVSKPPEGKPPAPNPPAQAFVNPPAKPALDEPESVRAMLKKLKEGT